ncbi:hypothetical protein SAMN05444920_104398 [Nonomuraea solani]|uniref:Uncharacterized protein n=1 Tax=Nonomuraea solani TaxID=1144553 RepID=A0A1H6CUF7_9ACTN|nr:hypothetical protein [Nonomuraea solani]SEG76592.1 hypothetical protein SAMN05444920_104398 [Nonomuraea solani]
MADNDDDSLIWLWSDAELAVVVGIWALLLLPTVIWLAMTMPRRRR